MKNKGITLVALVVTIIILLILAGITITQLRDNGLFKNTKYAADETKKREIEEQINLAVLASYGTDGKIDNDLLKENLNKIKGIEKIEEVVYPLTAKVDGYEFIISDTGTIKYKGEIQVADEDKIVDTSSRDEIIEALEARIKQLEDNSATKTELSTEISKINTDISNIDIPENNYSTTEQVVGTWKDGKTIYRKVVTLSYTPVWSSEYTFEKNAIEIIDRECRVTFRFNSKAATSWTDLLTGLPSGRTTQPYVQVVCYDVGGENCSRMVYYK